MGKNRPNWQIKTVATGSKHPARLPEPRTAFGDFSPGSGRVQCIAIARSGQQCRKDALHGSTCCGSHGGHKIAYKSLAQGLLSTRSGIGSTRSGLAKLSTVERYPIGEAWSLSPVERGKRIEMARNRKLGFTVRKPET
jgi:hypothetical protein